MNANKLIGGIILIIILAVIIRNSGGFAEVMNASGGQLVNFTNAAVGK